MRDRGAIAITAALCLTVIFGFTALSVDLGNQWQHRRGLITSTDAAALAAAQEYALGGTGCDVVAGSYVTANNSDATMNACTPSPLANDVSGSVKVAAETTVNYLFAPVIGFNQKVVTSSTTARWGIPKALNGLRPLGLCDVALDGVAEYMAWLSAGLVGSSEPAKIPYGKSNANDCNGGSNVPGNWGILDFDGGSNSNNDTKEWVENGFPGAISTDDWVEGDPGAFSPSLAASLDALMDVGTFGLPLFSQASGNGANATFEVSSFVSVTLVGYKVNGSSSSRYLEVIFERATLTGECCDNSAVDRGVRVMQICATEATDPTLACAG
jgi:Flp pilus assembly protein TadG